MFNRARIPSSNARSLSGQKFVDRDGVISSRHTRAFPSPQNIRRGDASETSGSASPSIPQETPRNQAAQGTRRGTADCIPARPRRSDEAQTGASSAPPGGQRSVPRHLGRNQEGNTIRGHENRAGASGLRDQKSPRQGRPNARPSEAKTFIQHGTARARNAAAIACTQTGGAAPPVRRAPKPRPVVRRQHDSDEAPIIPRHPIARRWKIFDAEGPQSDADLEAWGSHYIPGFQAVIPRTEFKEVAELQPGYSWILNLDRGLYDRGGTHWVGVYVSKVSPTVFYYDPFGMPPPKEVPLMAYREGRGILYSNVRYQDFDEENCGPRVLAVLNDLSKSANDYASFAELSQES